MNKSTESLRKPTAITGGVAMGKSVVLEIISDLGFSVASADEIARDVFEERNIQIVIAELLALEVPLDRNRVRQGIAANQDFRRAMNRIMHPEILKRMRSIEVDFMEVPLLIESCMQAEFESVWVVSCPRDIQEARLTARVGSPDEARQIISTQLANEIKEVFADAVIRTNQPISNVRDDIEKLLRAR